MMIKKKGFCMTLTNGDKAICAQIAGEVSRKIMSEHVKNCPHAMKAKIVFVAIVCTALGSSIGTGSIVWQIAKSILR